MRVSRWCLVSTRLLDFEAPVALPDNHLTTGDHTDELVRAIIAMGKALGLAVVAEGIETTEQLELLRQIGCESGQGFLFAPAVPADDVSELFGRTLGTGQHNPHEQRRPARRTASWHGRDHPAGSASKMIDATRIVNLH
jgi:hypothetical protein